MIAFTLHSHFRLNEYTQMCHLQLLFNSKQNVNFNKVDTHGLKIMVTLDSWTLLVFTNIFVSHSQFPASNNKMQQYRAFEKNGSREKNAFGEKYKRH